MVGKQSSFKDYYEIISIILCFNIRKRMLLFNHVFLARNLMYKKNICNDLFLYTPLEICPSARHFQCLDHLGALVCYPSYVMCDGHDDCGDGMDETAPECESK